MFKKVSAVVFTSLMLGALAGCGGTSSSSSSVAGSSSSAPTSVAPTDVALKVWGPQKEQALLATQTAAFDLLHPEWNITWTLGTVEEPDLKATLLQDVTVGGDVFAFPDDQLADLVGAGAISEVTQGKTAVIARNSASTVGSATFGGKLYAYPETADNGYFMYYDSSAITLEQMGSLDSMISIANAAGKKIMFDPAGGWQGASFFLNTSNSITFNGTTQTCDWNNAAGLAAAKGMWNAFGSGTLLNGGDVSSLFADGTILAAVTGTWNAAALQTVLGDHYAATKMPTYTNGNGDQVQLGSFTGSKLIGVKSSTAYPQAAHAFANYVTNEENQLLRFESRELGPSNIAAAANAEVQANVALAALSLQANYGYAQSTSVGGTFWTPAGAFCTMCYSQDLGDFGSGDVGLQAALDAMVAQIVATA